MESRIHGDVYVRFGGERLETYRPKGRQGALRLACEASSCGGSVAVRQIFCGPRSVGPPLPGRGGFGCNYHTTGLR